MLPKHIDPIQLANNQTRLKGEISLSKMERLVSLLCDKKGSAIIDLDFGRDPLGYAYICGSIKTWLKISCQRCNNPMSLELDIAMEVSPVRTMEEAARLPKQYEPLVLTDDTISLVTIVEEEILLNIPIVPRHSPRECPVKPSHLIEWEEETKGKNHPFDVLKKLLGE